jgi:hypothetical protein
MSVVCRPVGVEIFTVVVMKSSIFWIKYHTVRGKSNNYSGLRSKPSKEQAEMTVRCQWTYMVYARKYNSFIGLFLTISVHLD